MRWGSGCVHERRCPVGALSSVRDAVCEGFFPLRDQAALRVQHLLPDETLECSRPQVQGVLRDGVGKEKEQSVDDPAQPERTAKTVE